MNTWFKAKEIKVAGFYFVLLLDGSREPAFFKPGGKLNGIDPAQEALVCGPIEIPLRIPQSNPPCIPMVGGWYWIFYEKDVKLRWVNAGFRFREGLSIYGPIEIPDGPPSAPDFLYLAASCIREGKAKGWNDPAHHIRRRTR